MEEEEHCSTGGESGEGGQRGMGASLMWVEKGHIRKTEEARVEEQGGEDNGVVCKLFIINPIYFCLKDNNQQKAGSHGE